MRLSDKFPVPPSLALLYDFVNSIDLRTYVEQGEAHVASDELRTAADLEAWMRTRDVPTSRTRLGDDDLARALSLRAALRAFLALEPGERIAGTPAARRLSDAAAAYPLVAEVPAAGGLALRPAQTGGGIARVVAELYDLGAAGNLDRLRLCASSECRWMFYDRTKPGNRRWCSSALCGNRQKTRAYRDRKAKA